MKKTALLLFCALLLASGMSACGGSGENTKNTEAPGSDTSSAPGSESGTEEAEDEYLTSLDEMDFRKAEYSVIVTRLGNSSILHPATDSLTGERLNDALYMRDRKIEDDYNVKIAYPYYADSSETGMTVAKSVMAGTPICDVYIDALSTGYQYLGYAFQQKTLYNLVDLPYLQLDKPWWSPLMYEKMMFNDKMFFTCGDMSPYYYGGASCTFMNFRVAADNDIDYSEVYRLVYDGKWTVDEMMLLTKDIKRDMNGDGVIKIEDDQLGVVNDIKSLTAQEILIGEGIQMISVDGDGNLTVDLTNQRVIDAVEKAHACFTDWNGSGDLCGCFMSDRALFWTHMVESAIQSLRNMESDYAILPMPKYDAEQESYMTYINPHTHAFIAVPSVLEDPERTGFITEVMEYLSYKTVRPEVYENTLKGKIARDPDTQAMLDIIFDTAYTDINAVMNFGGTADALSNGVFYGKEVVSAIDKAKNKIEKNINKMLEIYDAD